MITTGSASRVQITTMPRRAEKGIHSIRYTTMEVATPNGRPVMAVDILDEESDSMDEEPVPTVPLETS